MEVKFSEQSKGILGISGHAGVGHVHSHSGFVQDDSAGLAAAALILKKALPVDTRILEVHASMEEGRITVRTNGGGEASASPRRGIAPFEKELLENRGVNLDAAFSQNAAVRVFGRMYGQGVSETASCFQGACALAVLDTFVKAAPGRFHISAPAGKPGYLDRAITTVLDVDGIPMALMLLVNFTEGGIGPAEDYEGNVPWDFKEPVMKAVGLNTVPTILIESKAYIPAFAPELTENMLMLRAEEGTDNLKLAQTLLRTAKEMSIPCCLKQNAMPLVPGSLAKATAAYADRLIALAKRLKVADDCMEKVRLTAKLAELISQDAGGVTFMGNTVNDQMRGAGIVPGSHAILSMIVTTKYKEYVKIPMLTEEDAAYYVAVILNGMKRYHSSL
ncbi:MAG: hypothetical protein HFI66_09150 [Lachnospiraceae bacterium]|jgi:hypothetical protein|nr:hypothetical protein [Lachnospiraceae bacterium]